MENLDRRGKPRQLSRKWMMIFYVKKDLFLSYNGVGQVYFQKNMSKQSNNMVLNIV